MSIGQEHGAPGPDPGKAPDKPDKPNKKWMIVLGVIIGVFVVLAVYDLISSGSALIRVASKSSAASSAAARATPAATASPSPSSASASATASPTATASPSASLESAQALSIASAAAFGPEGTSDGDNPVSAWRVIGATGQPWHSSWYTTPEFGNLQSGTGILLDMGKTVTVSRVRLVLGDSVGADIQLRIGDSVTPSDLSTAASATNVGGTVKLQVTSPVSGRYVLVWFTRLPPNSQGKYQIDVYSATVYGIKGT